MNTLLGFKQVWSLLKTKNSIGLILRLGYFIILYYFAGIILYYLESRPIPIPIFVKLHSLLQNVIICISTWLLKFFYSPVYATSDHIIKIDQVMVIQLLPGCSGLIPLLRMTFILIFYPIDLFKKLLIFPFSIMIALFAAILHFVILVPIAFQTPKWYNFSHNWVAEIIFYTLFFSIWLLWEKVITQRNDFAKKGNPPDLAEIKK